MKIRIKGKKRATIIDVARKAGVSKSTVSLAMKNSPLLARKTLKRVQEIAKKLRYRPNMLFSIMGSGNRLKKKKIESLPIAFLYDDKVNLTRERLPDFAYLPEIALRYGYIIEPFNLREFNSAEDVEKVLYHRGYVAIIIGRIINRDSVAYDLKLKDFSVASNTNTLWRYNFHRVSGDVFKALQMAWDKCVEAGYVRIGAAPCRHNPSVPDDDLRLAAVLERQRHYEGKVEIIPPFQGETGAQKLFLEWVNKWQPDAIIGFHIGQYYILKENLPENIFSKLGFCSLIVNPIDEWSNPISGVIYQEKEVAETTISILDHEVRNRIQGMPKNIMHINLTPKWHEGKTLPLRKKI